MARKTTKTATNTLGIVADTSEQEVAKASGASGDDVIYKLLGIQIF